MTLDAATVKMAVTAHLKELSSRDLEVIRLRYGLDGKGTRTLEEIANQFKISRERVRQIEVDALKKLKLAK